MQEVVGLRGVALQRVDRDDVTTRAVGELRGSRELRVDDAELDGLLEGVERLVELALVPEDVRELVPGVAVDLVVRRRVLDDLGVRLRGEIPLRGIALRFVEEQFAEREVCVGNVLRVRTLLDEVVVDLARLREVARLLVLVREVVQNLVELAIGRVVVDDERVVLDRLLPRGLHHRVGLVGLRLLLAGLRGVRLLEAVALDLRFRLVAEGGGFELYVRFCETTRELRAVGRVLLRGLEEALDALDLGDEQRALARLKAALALVTRGVLQRRVARLRLLIALLQIRGRRSRMEVHLRSLAVLADVELFRSVAAARIERGLRLVVDADLRRVGEGRDATNEQGA